LRTSFITPYLERDISARYKLVQGNVAFHGSTVAGESRELCGQDLGFGILNGSPQLFQECLPRQFKAMGFHTIAAHGNSGYFFRRSDWYGRMGFDETQFRSDFHRQGLPECVGAVLGTCDAAIAQWIGTKLGDGRSSPQFVYWVTLNSHLPVPVPVPPSIGGESSCSTVIPLADDPSLCSWYELIANVHRSIADLAMANSARPTVFVVVGDHAPPFADPRLRGLFSGTTVPYVVLIPRSIEVLPR
jgi:phosphoglycerol transferase MdoB-like AlkP superfamily enzyme